MTGAPGSSRIGANGKLITRCAVAGCAEVACFGYGVSLRKGRAGQWFCRDHRPAEGGNYTGDGANGAGRGAHNNQGRLI